MALNYDFDYLKRIIIIFLIPLLVLIILSGIFLMIYSMTERNKDKEYQYIMSFYSLLLGIIVLALLTAFSLGFSASLIKAMAENNIINSFKFIYIGSYILPIIPATFLVILIRRIVRIFTERNAYEENIALQKAKKVTTKKETI